MKEQEKVKANRTNPTPRKPQQTWQNGKFAFAAQTSAMPSVVSQQNLVKIAFGIKNRCDILTSL